MAWEGGHPDFGMGGTAQQGSAPSGVESATGGYSSVMGGYAGGNTGDDGYGENMSSKAFIEALERATLAAVNKNREFMENKSRSQTPAPTVSNTVAMENAVSQSPSVNLNAVTSDTSFNAGAEEDPDISYGGIGSQMAAQGAFADSSVGTTSASEDANVSMGHPDFGMSGTADTDIPRDQRNLLAGTIPTFRGSPHTTGPIVEELDLIEDPVERSLTQEFLNKFWDEQVEQKTSLGRVFGQLAGVTKSMSLTNMIGELMDKGLKAAGFTTDSSLNIVGKARRAAQEAMALGPDYGVSSIGHGRATGDGRPAQLPGIKQAIMQSEPWMRGLTERQIKWYLERPDQLNWVRNTWNELLGGQ